MTFLKKHAILILLVALTCAIYWPVTNGEYLADWDDDQQILNNPDVTGLSWQSVKNYFTSYYVASYQPLASLSFGIEYAFFRENAFVHHFTNLMLHLFNVVLLYVLLSKLFGKKHLMVLFVTAVFAFHPLQTEVVGWISTRSTLMYSGFFFLACLAYIRYLRKEQGKMGSILLCALFFALALFSKAAAVTLPLVLLLLDYFYKRQFSWKLLLEKIPFFIGSVAIGLASIDSRKVLDSIGDFSSYYTFFEKTALSAYTLVFYFWKSIVPGNLYTYYGYPMKIDDAPLGTLFWLAPFALILLLVILWWVYRKSGPEFRRQWVLGIAFFAINIGLVINFTPFGPTMAAERYMYLPIIGIYTCLGLALFQLYSWSQGKNLAYIIITLSLLFFAIRSNAQARVWENRVSLWENAITHTNAPYPWMELGNEYQKRGEIDRAIEYYNGGVAINPYYTKIYYYRGIAIKTKGDKDYAKIDFERVIKSGGDKKGDAFYERGLLYEEANMLDSAMADYDSALFYRPEGPAMFRKNALADDNQALGSQSILLERMSLMLNKGDSLMQAGSLDEALSNFENVLLLNPGMERALMSKGLIQSAQSDFAAAAETFTQLIDKSPQNQRARLSRAFAYTQTREYDKSIEDYNYVTNTLGARTGEILYFKAIALLNAGQKEQACQDLGEAVEKGHNAAGQLRAQTCT